MPGYVEIAVTVPVPETPSKPGPAGDLSGPTRRLSQALFPSSHSFPPNTLGFGRGYDETLPKDIESHGLKKGDAVQMMIEGQSDWAQQYRDTKANETLPNETVNWKSEANKLADPLLSQYERLIVKNMIDLS